MVEGERVMQTSVIYWLHDMYIIIQCICVCPAIVHV